MIWNDVRQNKLLSAATVFFMAVSAMMLALAALLFFSLLDSTQDNGLCTQSKRFDYLPDMDNDRPKVLPGQVYVPVCHRTRYELNIGDTMRIGSGELTVAGFLRDAQMNSMMASSKRFLVSEFSTVYTRRGLPSNGPAITKPLICMMNALSDGTTIALFLRLIVERNRDAISLQKAPGFTGGDIGRTDCLKGFLSAAAGRPMAGGSNPR